MMKLFAEMEKTSKREVREGFRTLFEHGNF